MRMGFWQKTKQKKVKIIFPNGESLCFHTPIIVCELILQYPHHYCLPYVPGSSLSMNDELQGGKTYLLLPRPNPLISIIPPISNSRPSNGMDLTLKRVRTWTSSLLIIAKNENSCLLQQQLENEHKSIKKQDTKLVKSASVRPKSTLNKNSWHRETGMNLCMTPMGSPGFLF